MAVLPVTPEEIVTAPPVDPLPATTVTSPEEPSFAVDVPPITFIEPLVAASPVLIETSPLLNEPAGLLN